jgi:hypothetical protein
MGGFGSGGWRYRGASHCEHLHRVDLAYMNRNGLLRPYMSGSLSWSRGGEQTGRINYTVLPDALRLTYRYKSHIDSEWTPIAEEFAFSWTPTAFGGQRRWLLCPGCRRRCRILYGGARFRCRKCQRLVYESQYEAPWQRLLTRAQTVRQKLGGSGSMDDPFPPKPKGMHWKTYWRLEAEDQRADEQWARLMLNWLDRHRI